MRRVFIAPAAVQGDQITVHDPATLHHLCRVLRLRVGDRLECFDGRGNRYVGTVTRREAGVLSVAVEQHSAEPPERFSLTLAQGMIRPERLEWVIEKATELRVNRIIPMWTARTVRGPARGRTEARLQRWRRIAAEAATQSGRSVVPTIDEPCEFAEALKRLQGCENLLLTLASQGLPLAQVLGACPSGSWAVWIGPEGDFSPEEGAAAQRAGARLVRLGRAVLRSETAAVAAIAVVQQHAGML